MDKMRTVLIILMVVMSVGCSTMEQKAHFSAMSNFTYVADVGDSWDRYDPSKPFSGDCEDFAFSLQTVIDGDVYRVKLNTGTYHAVILKDGIVYDNLYNHPKPVSLYPAEFINVMEYPK